MFQFVDNNVLTSAQLNGNFTATLDKTVATAQTVVGPVTYSAGLTSTATTTLSGAQVNGVSIITSGASYSVTTSDRFVLVNKTTGSATQINLPANAAQGRILTFKDAKGDCFTNNITLVAAGTDRIDGASNLVLNVNFSAIDLVYSGSSWAIV